MGATSSSSAIHRGHGGRAGPGAAVLCRVSVRRRPLLPILIAILSVHTRNWGCGTLGSSVLKCLRNLRSVSTVVALFSSPAGSGQEFLFSTSSGRWSLSCCCFESSHPNSCEVTSQCPWWLSHTGRPGEVWHGLWSPPMPATCAGQGRCVLGTGAGRWCLQGVGGVWRKGALRKAKLIPSTNPAH